MTPNPCTLGFLLALLPAALVSAEEAVGPLDRWRANVIIAPVLGDAECHSIHSYFNTSPESPDGKHVLLYRSTTPDAHEGEICLARRDSHEVTSLVQGVTAEDAHRVACQQWSCQGREIVFHDLRDGGWVVAAVDVQTGQQRVLARDRLVGWGQPGGETVPLYGPHWNPGRHRDLELLNVRTGEIESVLTADHVRAAYPEWVQRQFGQSQISVFFPILSPDEKRLLVKIAAPHDGTFRSPTASNRQGLLCVERDSGRLTWMNPSWGHPAWRADSRQIINVYGKRIVSIDAATGSVETNQQLPPFPGSHPSFSPDGKLFVTDVRFDTPAGSPETWGVAVGECGTGEWTLLHRFNHSAGATSWRRSHPHPVFSPDGRRIYYNVSSTRWTQLHVAECAQ